MLSPAWPAPAKLNLFLHIIGRQNDGFHLLQTVFQFIDLIDEIDFTLLDQNRITRHSELSGVAIQDDLVVRAATKLKRATDYKKGVAIHLTKNIPLGGGLGGGSSDAATTLVALNELWQTGLGVDDLAKLGLAIGADVPVFIHAQAAWAEGIGEKLTPIILAECVYLVICPSCHVATSEIFNAPDLTRNTPAITIDDFLKQGGGNDCEASVRCRYREVAQALDWLNDFAPAKLTGTGACLFAKFDNVEAATMVQQQVPDRWQSYIVKSMNQSPLQKRLAKEQAKN